MKIYENKSRFFCTPLKRYIPEGALVARYENATKIVIIDAPRTDVDPFNQLVDGFEFDNPKEVTWLYGVEPPPLGDDTTQFTLIGQKDEDEFGNTGATDDGLPPNSQLRIGLITGGMYLQNVDTLLFHPLRITGPDGSVSLQVGQNGVTEENIV